MTALLKMGLQRWRTLSITTKFGLAFGLLLVIILVITGTGYIALTLVQRQTESSILTSTSIQKLVLAMKADLEEARRLEREFFLRYPKIGFSAAQKKFIPHARESIANAAAFSVELQKLIARSRVSDALRKSDVNLKYYLIAAERYAELLSEAVAQVKQLSDEHSGLQQELKRHSSTLQKQLLDIENSEALLFYYQMRAFENEYWVTRKRPFMQSAFNQAFLLRKFIEELSFFEKEQVLSPLRRYQELAEQILQLDVEIHSKINEFDLQADAIYPISEDLIVLAEKEVELARDRIHRTNRTSLIILGSMALAGLLIAGGVAYVMHFSITRNVIALTKAAKGMREGHLSVSARIENDDELGQLADTFNAMAARIDSLVHNLELKVTNRTRELTNVNTQLHQEIAERERAEELVHKLNAELEERVRARTAELEAVNQELRSFAYVASHDLKAPLRGISQLAQWLEMDYESLLDEEGKKLLFLLINRVKRMDELINGILEYSRIGRVVGEERIIDLGTLVPDIIDGIAPPEHIHIEVEDELPSIVADQTRIVQVFQNLLSNAVKFLDKPHGRVRLSCVENGDVWVFGVADNGPGIDAKYHEKIFQIFQTLAPRDTVENTGIGLSLVKKIVGLHGGTIWVESIVGEGSTFFFTLPKARGRLTSERLARNA